MNQEGEEIVLNYFPNAASDKTLDCISKFDLFQFFLDTPKDNISLWFEDCHKF